MALLVQKRIVRNFTVLSAAIAAIGLSAEANAQYGPVIIVQLENQVSGSIEEIATGTAKILQEFTAGPGAPFEPVINIDINFLICRSRGNLTTDIVTADPLGDAFYALHITTVNEPRTRLHIFNTNCREGGGVGSFGLAFIEYFTRQYLFETGQTADDILLSPITLEIIAHLDQDGDGLFEEEFVVLSGSTN